MDQKKRILLGASVLVLIVLLVAGGEALRRSLAVLPVVQSQSSTPGQPTLAVTLVPGSVPVYLDGQLVAGFSPDALKQLKQVSFVEPIEGKSEEGWLLRDVLLLYLKPEQFKADTQITVSSSSRKKSAQLTWAEISEESNMVMFDLANRGTLKLVSKLERLDTREEWVQDVDKIEIQAAKP